jgi:hypothetical protein
MSKRQPPTQTVVLADLKRDAVRIRRQAVLDRLDEILELYSSAHSFEQIVGMLQIAESPNYVRNVVMDSAYKQYTLAHRARAHTMVEKAVDVARQAISIGDSGGYRVATDSAPHVATSVVTLAPEARSIWYQSGAVLSVPEGRGSKMPDTRPMAVPPTP